MRRTPVAPYSVERLPCHWLLCPGKQGTYNMNATENAHVQVHVDRDRHTLVHFQANFQKYFSFICLMERILNAVISHLDFCTVKVSAFLP